MIESTYCTLSKYHCNKQLSSSSLPGFFVIGDFLTDTHTHISRREIDRQTDRQTDERNEGMN